MCTQLQNLTPLVFSMKIAGMYTNYMLKPSCGEGLIIFKFKDVKQCMKLFLIFGSSVV